MRPKNETVKRIEGTGNARQAARLSPESFAAAIVAAKWRREAARVRRKLAKLAPDQVERAGWQARKLHACGVITASEGGEAVTLSRPEWSKRARGLRIEATTAAHLAEVMRREAAAAAARKPGRKTDSAREREAREANEKGKHDATARRNNLAAAGTGAGARLPWEGAAILERGLYRLAARCADSMAVRWLQKNAAGAVALGWRGRGAIAEHSGNQGDDINAAVELVEEVKAEFRAVFLAGVPFLVQRIAKRGRRRAIRRLIRAARRVAWRIVAGRGGAAHKVLYRLRGRDKRESYLQAAEENGNRLYEADWIGGGRMARPDSSDPRHIASGGAGRRPFVMDDAAAGMAAAMDKAAILYARRGAGSHNAREGARNLMTVTVALESVLSGDVLPPDTRAEFSAGKQGGVSDLGRKHVAKWLAASGLISPSERKAREAAAAARLAEKEKETAAARLAARLERAAVAAAAARDLRRREAREAARRDAETYALAVARARRKLAKRREARAAAAV
jgi:hypothetical protein